MQILWLEGPSAAREKLCAFLASFPGCGGNPAPVSVETRLPRSPLPRGGAGGRCPSPGLQPLSGWERPQSPFNLSVPLLPCLPFLLSFRAQNRILEPALLYGLRGGRCTGARACEPPCARTALKPGEGRALTRPPHARLSQTCPGGGSRPFHGHLPLCSLGLTWSLAAAGV